MYILARGDLTVAFIQALSAAHRGGKSRRGTWAAELESLHHPLQVAIAALSPIARDKILLQQNTGWDQYSKFDCELKHLRSCPEPLEG